MSNGFEIEPVAQVTSREIYRTIQRRFADLPGNAGAIDVYTPMHGEGPFPVVAWTRGSAWMRDNGNELGDWAARNLVSAGIAVAAYAVRSTGQAQFPAQLEDGWSALTWLADNATDLDIDPHRIAVMGGSSGGWVSTMLGVTSDRREVLEDLGIDRPLSEVRVGAVVDLFGPTDFLQMDEHLSDDDLRAFNQRVGTSGGHADPLSPESRLVGGRIVDHPDRVRDANPLTYISPTVPPMLICHGASDGVVPSHQSSLLFDALHVTGVKAVHYTIHGFGHEYGFLDTPPNELVYDAQSAGSSDLERFESTPPNWDAVISFLKDALDV